MCHPELKGIVAVGLVNEQPLSWFAFRKAEVEFQKGSPESDTPGSELDPKTSSRCIDCVDCCTLSIYEVVDDFSGYFSHRSQPLAGRFSPDG